MKIFRIKFKDRLYAVKADTLYDALYKLSQNVNIVKCNDRVSPMIYHGLHELGYTTEQLSGKSEEEINQLYYSKKRSNAVESITQKQSTDKPKPHTQSSIQVKPLENTNIFSTALHEARDSLKQLLPEGFWRVDNQSPEDLKEMDAKMFISKNGSTYAIKPDGDIIGVCKSGNDRGSELLQHAIKNGGDRLDSFAGNNEFYMRNGFEPVCYIKFDPNYPPEDWTPKMPKEDIVFYRYTGRRLARVKWKDIKKHIRKISGKENNYDAAYKYRDHIMEDERDGIH